MGLETASRESRLGVGLRRAFEVDGGVEFSKVEYEFSKQTANL